MYDIRQFLPTLYAVVLFGFTGYALAAQAAAMWVVSVGAALLNGWLVASGRFRPLPRLVANVLTLTAVAYIVLKIRTTYGPPILVVGEFLVILQLVKLYERRSGRDEAQLLVLSLLLMVAASINTASLYFGLLLITYLVLSLYACLLFHLKAETDAVRPLLLRLTTPTPGSTPAAGVGSALDAVEDGSMFDKSFLRQDVSRLGSSMRRLTAFVTVIATTAGVLVFLFFPRDSGAGMFTAFQPFRPSQALTGFQEEVDFQSVARITQNTAEVAIVELRKGSDDEVWSAPTYTGTLLLRGVTLDRYDDDPNSPGRWQWSRTTTRQDSSIFTPDRGQQSTVRPDAWAEAGGRSVAGADATTRALLRQSFVLRPTGTRTMFALPGILTVTSRQDGLRYRFAYNDGVLQSEEPLRREIRYDITSDGLLRYLPTAWGSAPDPIAGRGGAGETDPLLAYALRPGVSGEATNGSGSLGEQRMTFAAAGRGPDELAALDRAIASRMERHLREDFEYTLDLTDARQTDNADPILSFLTDFRRGHCEYFAGAMALMLQRLGIEARVVVGFKSDEYNSFAEHYVVRQSHAHAWVEVREGDEWRTYDPTSGREAEQARQNSTWQRFRHFLSFLEYKWADNVVAYNADSRSNIIDRTEMAMVNRAVEGGFWLKRVQQWFDRGGKYAAASGVISTLVGLMIALLAGAVVWFVVERVRLWRRVRRIGLEGLSDAQRLRLARQLGFYDDLLRLLDRHGIRRQPHQTPREFSRSVDHLPAGVFESVGRLTDLFYRIRYGGAELTPLRQRWLGNVIDSVADTLDRKPVRS